MSLATTELSLTPCYRIIDGRFRAIDLFERVDSLPVGTINFKISCRDSVLVYSNERVAQNIIESLWD